MRFSIVLFLILGFAACSLLDAKEEGFTGNELALLLAAYQGGGGGSADGTGVPMGGQILKPLLLDGIVSTFVGTAGFSGTADGTGAVARFFQPRGLCTDGTNLYIADGGNHSIRKIVIATGFVTTLAGTSGSSGTSDGTGAIARFNTPFGITCDTSNIYVADTQNHTIRKVVIATGEVTTLAGSAGISGTTDATGGTARFNTPTGLTTDGTNLYVADFNNHTIRKIIISSGAVTTLAGSAGSSGSTDASGSSALFNTPRGITTDATNLFVTDQSNHTIRKIVIADASVTTLAGSSGSSGTADGTGSVARFNTPVGITTDGVNLYVTDSNNFTVRQIVASSGVVTTLAGSAGNNGSTDGTGSVARFLFADGVTVDGTSLYTAELGNHTIRKVQ